MILRALIPIAIFMTCIELYKGWFDFKSILAFLVAFVLYRVTKYLLENVESVWIFLLIDFPLLCLAVWIIRSFGRTFLLYSAIPLLLPLIIIPIGTIWSFGPPQKFYKDARWNL